jgi:hypothetical protein
MKVMFSGFVEKKTNTKIPRMAIALFLAILLLPLLSQAQAQGLVARWSMDEGSGLILVDSSGSNNNGRIAGSPSWVSGVRGLALNLNGANQYAAVRDTATLHFTNAITLAAWISPTFTVATTSRILAKAQMDANNGFELSLASAGKVFVRFNQFSKKDTLRINSATSYPLNTGVWMHVAATYDGATIRLYINGVQEASLAAVFTIGSNADSLYIGRQKDNSSPYFYKGKVDEARVYNYALSPSEILALSQHTITAGAGSGGSISPSGNVMVNHGASQAFTITPTLGFHIADLTVDGVSVGPLSSYNFTGVATDHTITASFAIDTFTIVASAAGGGQISPNGNVTVNYGADQIFYIVPNSGYHIADVVVDGSSIGATGTYTFNNILANHSISATFSIDTFTLSASSGPNGSITPAGNIVVNYGANQTFDIAANTGYHIVDVVVDGTSMGPISSYTFTAVIANHFITASFAITTFTITATAGPNGTISPDGIVYVDYGATQVFNINPNIGYHVADVLVDGESAGAINTYTFTSVNGNHSISATFAINTYTITASAGPHGSITPSGEISVNYNASQSFIIAANTGYHIVDVAIDGSSIGVPDNYTFNSIIADHSISASFAINSYTITASAGLNGSISPSGTVVVNYGDNLTFNINPNTGYHIVDVLVDGGSIGATGSYTFNSITSNHTISASFAISSFNISATAGLNGTITPSGNIVVNYGADQTFAINPNPGYHIVDVLVDGITVGAIGSYTFYDVIANHSITASFGLETYLITASAGANGNISPSGNVIVNLGDSKTFNINANIGYHILNVLVDGSSVGAPSSYTFDNVTANHSISATFEIDSYIIVASAGPNGSIAPAGNVAVNYGADQNFNIIADAGYHVADVLVDGISIGPAANYTFYSVAANHAIIASFISNAIDMVGHWAFEEISGNTAIDSTIYHNNGLLYNNPQRVAGVRGQALLLNGTNQYVAAGDSSILDITSAITLMAWVKPEKQGTQYIIKKSRQGGTPVIDDGFELALANLNSSDPPYGDGRAFVRFNQSSSQNTYRLNSLTQYPFDGNTWFHLAATYDGTTIRIYYNGIEENSKVGNFQIAANSLPLGIGAQGDGNSPLDGSIDDVRIYNYALTAGEIQHFASHIITASAGAFGTINPSGQVSVLHGRDTTYAIVPNTGCHIVDVLVDGSSVGAIGSYTFSSVTANHTIAATFALNTYTLLSSAGPNGTITPSGSTVVNYGADQTYSITPNQGYHVANVVVDGNDIGAVENYTFAAVAANHTINATFAINTYTLIASAGPNGSISPSGEIIVNYGVDQVFNIAPNTCYHIADVVVDGISIGATESYTFTSISANHSISATFAINTYTIAASAGPNGSITPSGNVVVNCGTDLTFNIAPATGYHIDDVLVDGVSVGPQSSITFHGVSSGHTISALFAINTFTISASTGPNGSISPMGDIVVNYGSELTLNITPDAGYHIADVLVDGNSVGIEGIYVFTNITANHTIAASFAVNVFTITATAGPHGSITPSNIVYVDYGANQTFEFNPNIGYHIAEVIVDGIGIGVVNTYTFENITANHTISVTFAINTFIITATAGENGTISPAGNVVVAYGSEQTFSIIFDSGCHIDDVIVDGESAGCICSYTFTDIVENHTIHAEFGLGEIPVIVSQPPIIGLPGVLYYYYVVATGIPSPTFTLLTYPHNMVIEEDTHSIFWVPELSGRFDVSIEARNFAGADTQTYQIIVGGCDYVDGDINNSRVLNGLDVIYGVSYFKGGPVPPYSCECTPGHIWFVSGDVNGSCTFNGLDITYLVSFFKGGPIPVPCPDCPPNGAVFKALKSSTGDAR